MSNQMSREEIYDKPLVTVAEFAFVTDMHRKTAERLIRKGKIPCVHMGKTIRVNFREFIKNRGVK